MLKIENDKYDYSKLVKYYKRKLVDYGAMKEVSGVKSNGKYISKTKLKGIFDKVHLSA